MPKRVLLVGAILGLLAIVGMVATILLMHPPGTGGGNFSVGKTVVQYATFGRDRAALVILSDAPGGVGSTGESGFFMTSFEKGFLTSAEGKRIEWEWISPRDKGGDFHLDGEGYDMSKGTLFLVATKGGKVRVTQLDADLSKFPIIRELGELPQRPGAARVDKQADAVKEWAKNVPKVAQFLDEVEGQR